MRLLVLVLVVQMLHVLVMVMGLVLGLVRLQLLQLLARERAHHAAASVAIHTHAATWPGTSAPCTTQPTGSRSKQPSASGPVGAQPADARAALRIVARWSPEGYCDVDSKDSLRFIRVYLCVCCGYCSCCGKSFVSRS